MDAIDGSGDVTVVRRFFERVWGNPSGPVPEGLVHPDYWADEPVLNSLTVGADGSLEALLTGQRALQEEVALYRDRYADLTLTIKEMFAGAAVQAAAGVALWEARRLVGQVFVVSWVAGATHPTRTITTRTGRQIPAHVGCDGTSLVRVVDGLVFSADKFWPRGVDLLAPDDATVPAPVDADADADADADDDLVDGDPGPDGTGWSATCSAHRLITGWIGPLRATNQEAWSDATVHNRHYAGHLAGVVAL